MGAVIKQTNKTNPVMGIPPGLSGAKVSHTISEGRRPRHVSSEGRKEDSRRQSTGQHPSLDRKLTGLPAMWPVHLLKAT